MTDSDGAPACAEKKRAHLPSPRRHTYTPELLAEGRRRFEQTDESLTDIAVDFGIHKSTLARLARREGWVRYVPPPRGLPAPARMLAQAQAMEASLDDDAPHQPPPEREKPPADAPLPSQAEIAGMIARLYRGVAEELSVIEATRARLGKTARSSLGAERTARSLSSLTETLHKLQRLRCALPDAEHDDDDIPADLDEFRLALARRIEAFVASRLDGRDAGEGRPATAVDPLR